MLKLIISGPDATTFITRQSSNSITQAGSYCAFLKPKGEIVALAFVIASGDTFEIYTKQATLKEHLEKFIIVEDVSISQEEVSAEYVFEDVGNNESIVKVYERDPKIFDKYVNFDKGCFPGQEVLSKFKNLGLRKREERSQELTAEALEVFAVAKTSFDASQTNEQAKANERAIELLKKALKEDPRNEEAYESLGVILGRQGNYHEAIKVMEQLEIINPQSIMAQMNLSVFYMKINEIEKAEEHKAKSTVLQFEDALKK